MKKITNIDVTIKDVLRAFWLGVKPWRWPFFLSILGFFLTFTVDMFAPLLYKRFFDVITTSAPGADVVPALVSIIFSVFLLHSVGWVSFRISLFALNNADTKIMARLKQISFEHLIHHSYAFFANNFTGSLIQRINRFARAFETLSDTFIFNILRLLVETLGAVIVVGFLSPMIALVLLVWVLGFMAFNYAFSRWKLKYDIESAAADSRTTALLSDTITNQNNVSLFSAAEYEAGLFKDITNDQARITRRVWNLNAIVDGAQAGLMILVEFFVFYFSIKYWQTGEITVGTFVLIQTYLLSVGHQLWSLSKIIRNLYQGLADSKEMVEVLLLAHEVRDVPHAKTLVVKNGEIKFENLSFSFNQTRTVLDNLSATIKSGEKVALIGPSGAGKSTFVRLILRLYDAAGGRILIDGQNIQKVTQDSLREAVSMVPQDPVLFHRTLLENIRYGRKDATDEEVIAAATLAHCDEFIEGLPLKYDTYVGERGIKLSGGERQRVAIARAILKNAPILVLDEATSSLDSHSEALIQDALDKLMKGKTTIVIAHRLSTIRKMDRIIVIDNGRIMEEGSHETLLTNNSSLYKKLWDLQAGGFIKDSI